jgi:hypothetical protein
MWRILAATAALSMAAPGVAAVLITDIGQGPPSGFRQSFSVDFAGGSLTDASLSYFLPFGKLWYDPDMGSITGNEYFFANDCTPGSMCSPGLVRNFSIRDQNLSFSFHTPRSFNNCVVGENPYGDCAFLYDAPTLSLTAALTGDLPVSFEVARSAVSAVPEPATWAMMIFGFGAVGVAMRRRKSAPTLVNS